MADSKKEKEKIITKVFNVNTKKGFNFNMWEASMLICEQTKWTYDANYVLGK